MFLFKINNLEKEVLKKELNDLKVVMDQLHNLLHSTDDVLFEVNIKNADGNSRGGIQSDECV